MTTNIFFLKDIINGFSKFSIYMGGNSMIQSLEIRPLGVPLGKFVAEVDVIAQNVCNGNLVIKLWNNMYKELTFSEDDKCWVAKREMDNLPEDDEWRRLVKGTNEDETNICTTVPCET